MVRIQKMKPRRGILKAALLVSAAIPFASAEVSAAPQWLTVVNNGEVAPQSTPQAKQAFFFSYNQPAVSLAGQVVFRARARPKTGELASPGAGAAEPNAGNEPTRGVYTRPMTAGSGGWIPVPPGPSGPVKIIADNLGVLVPAPNTTGAEFIEFPSTPRSDPQTTMVATRAQSTPVVTLPDGTRVGTSGVYATMGIAPPTGTTYPPLVTAASQVGNIPSYSYFQVPTEPVGTRFDQFPGSPSPFAGRIITFKGNYTVNNVGKTGVFFRDLYTATRPVRLVVKSGMAIPGGGGKVFGSAAPPSAGRAPSTQALKVVFAGFDNEEKPTAGGIFISELGKLDSIKPIASIGGTVPGVTPAATFKGFGEGLSFDGRFVSFWGSWGEETMIVHKDCPTDGNADLIAYCKSQYPNGVDLPVPVNQGIFIADTIANTITPVARTTVAGYTDFLYWVYSGRPPGGPGGGEDDAEPPRWRSSAFSAVTPRAVAFKGQKGAVDGLYVKRAGVSAIITALDTTMTGQSVDPAAPAGSRVIAIGVERDGFRGRWLTMTASMLNETTTASWAGIYAHDCGLTCSVW